MNIPSQRPLSPHLQVYRLPLTALMSITHRVTGAALMGGLLLVAALFVAGAMGEYEFSRVMEIATSPFGLIVLLAWSVALFYHLVNGVRHLVWDIGYGYEKKQATASGIFVILVTLALTGATWYFAGVFEEDFYGQYVEIASNLSGEVATQVEGAIDETQE